MSAQRARSAVSADHRSAHPDIAGVPWWGAVLIAITATAIGFAFDAGSGSKELGLVFAACYFLGCVAAVLAVRQAAVFTAVIQPPLILFASVPTAYYLFTSDQAADLKDLAINCVYPLVERFPLMFFTSAGVLVIGMVRWYTGMSTRRATPRAADDVTAKPGLGSALTSKMSSLLARDPDDEEEVVEPPRRRRTAEERQRAAARRDGKPASRSSASRSRHVRPPEPQSAEPLPERPRRTRSARQAEPSAPEPRRRPRTPNPRKPGPPPSERRAEDDRAERRRRFDDYQPREPHVRNGNGNGNGNGTHHPISRVRYRGEEADDRARRRTTPRDRDAESWEYDV